MKAKVLVKRRIENDLLDLGNARKRIVIFLSII